jgi:hypothetical protein
MTRLKPVIGQSSRREDIKRSYSLASKEGRHKRVIGQPSRHEDI